MQLQNPSASSSSDEMPAHDYCPTSDYTYEELADIYNQARVDYIVPMPMNGKRMQHYVENYDIDLDASFVSLDPEDGVPTGVIMMGYRDQRGWITRLGVIPYKRRRKTGQFLMELCIQDGQRRKVDKIQLEVIKGNEPARKLFLKLGFVDTRELLIIRRPPGPPITDYVTVDDVAYEEIGEEQIADVLSRRTDNPSWVEESSSLLNSGQLKGLFVRLKSTDESGWIVFQRTPFQLTHFVMDYETTNDMIAAMIYSVHARYPMQDTKIENVPKSHRAWQVYQKMGYFEVFARQEMELYLK